MDVTDNTWIWVASLGGAGGAVGAWLARQRGVQPSLAGLRLLTHGTVTGRLLYIGLAATVAASTAAATAWMLGSASPVLWIGTRTGPAAVAFFWIGFVTAGWIAAERDKLLLHQAVCRAATAPAAHPDTIEELAHATPDAVYEAVKALVPRRMAR